MKPAKVGVAGMQKKKKASGLEVMLLGFCFFCCIESKEPVLLPPSLCCRDYQCISFFFEFHSPIGNHSRLFWCGIAWCQHSHLNDGCIPIKMRKLDTNGTTLLYQEQTPQPMAITQNGKLV